MKNLVLITIAFMLAFASCKKDNPVIDNPPIGNERNFSAVITSVDGVVMNQNNQPVEGAMVTFGSQSTMTDANGVFRINDESVMENRAFVKVDKAGYFHGSRTFFAYANKKETVRIHLLEKTIQGTVDASGGIVTTPEGVKLNFPANSVKDSDGNLFTGTVQVAAQYLDPAANDIFQIMPGDLRGITTDNVESGLTTYGMVAVELQSGSGEVLNVADGKTVTLTMPVGSEQLSSAPAEIPLWYFDETVGVWKEEGKATLQGNEYVGEVTHFSFWNCDWTWDLVYLDGSVLLDNLPLNAVTVCLTMDNGNPFATACDYTNGDGVFSGQVPTNTTFLLTVESYNLNCGTVMYSQEIGPFTTDVTLDPINIDGSTLVNSTLEVSGSIVDCDNNAITNGYVKVELDGQTYYSTTTDGTVDLDILHCGTTSDVIVTAVDLNGFTQSSELTFTYASPLDIGSVEACITLPEYIIYEYDGATYSLTEYVSIADADSLGQTGNLTIYAYDQNQSSVWLQTNATGLGTFDVDSFYATNVPGNTPNGGVAGMTVTFTQFSEVVGELNMGTFQGVVDVNGTDVPINGSFKAIRD